MTCPGSASFEVAFLNGAYNKERDEWTTQPLTNRKRSHAKAQSRKGRNVPRGSTMKLCVFAPLREIFCILSVWEQYELSLEIR